MHSFVPRCTVVGHRLFGEQGQGRGRAGLKSTEEKRLMEVEDPGEEAGDGLGGHSRLEQFLSSVPNTTKPTNKTRVRAPCEQGGQDHTGPREQESLRWEHPRN